jgi:prephenate dehydrogenase
MTSERETVAIIGLGLIGGSIARDLAAQGMRIAGYDTDPAALDQACEDGIVEDRLEPSLAGVEGADTVILAVPVSATRSVLRVASQRLTGPRLVTDVGSTKRNAVASAAEFGLGEHFVGSHPMAGGHRSGWRAAGTGLFRGARTYLCPTPSTGAEALSRATALWSSLGAHTEVIDAGAHDERVAFTSHLPHAVSSALAVALAKANCKPDDLGPGGRDMLRIAASSPELWTAIMMDNTDAVRDALAAFGAELERLSETLGTGDRSALQSQLSDAQVWLMDNSKS